MPLTEFPIPTKDLATAKAELLAALELENVDNTADTNKPVSTAQAAADDAHQAAAEATAQAALDAAVALLEAAIALKQNAATAVTSDTTQAGTGSVAITNIVSITETAYNALVGADSVDPNTHYIITGDDEVPVDSFASMLATLGLTAYANLAAANAAIGEIGRLYYDNALSRINLTDATS